MINLISEKYDKLKIYMKYNKDGKYNTDIDDEIVSLYATILGYYSAKLDMNYSENSTESLKDKIMLQSYDKKLVQKLNLEDYLDCFIHYNVESKRGEFNDTISFLKKTCDLDKDDLNMVKNNYDNGYLVTVLNDRQNKLNSNVKKKIYKKHKKGDKMLSKAHLN